MSAAISMPDDPRAEAWGYYATAREMTEAHIERLRRLEDGVVRLADRIEETRAAIERGQQLQIEALRLIAQVSR